MPAKPSKAILKARQDLIQICQVAQTYNGTMTIYDCSFSRTPFRQIAQAEGMTEAQYKHKLEQTYQVQIEIDNRDPTSYLIYGNWETAILMFDLVQQLTTHDRLLPPDK